MHIVSCLESSSLLVQYSVWLLKSSPHHSFQTVPKHLWSVRPRMQLLGGSSFLVGCDPSYRWSNPAFQCGKPHGLMVSTKLILAISDQAWYCVNGSTLDWYSLGNPRLNLLYKQHFQQLFDTLFCRLWPRLAIYIPQNYQAERASLQQQLQSLTEAHLTATWAPVMWMLV